MYVAVGGPHVAVLEMSAEHGYFEMFRPSQKSERKDEAICRLPSRSSRNIMLKLKMHAAKAHLRSTLLQKLAPYKHQFPP